MTEILTYKELQEEYKKIKIAYKDNLKLCQWQDKQINKLADVIEQIQDFAKQGYDAFVESDKKYTDFEKLAELMKSDFSFILSRIEALFEGEK